MKSELDNNKSSSSKLFEILGNHITSNTDHQTSDTGSAKPENAEAEKTSIRNRLLYIIPWLLLTAFIVSFFYDLDGFERQIFGYSVQFDSFIRIVSVSGLIGFLTNWIAITMLFRPQTNRPILGQGLIPAQKDKIAEKLSNAVNKNLINPDQIKEKLVRSGALTKVVSNVELSIRDLTKNEAFKDELFVVLTESVNEYLQNPEVKEKITTLLLQNIESSFQEKSFEQYAFKIYNKLRSDQIRKIIDNAISSIPKTIYQRKEDFDDILHSIPNEISNNRSNIELFLIQGIYDIMHRIDLKSIIQDNLNNYDEGRLEDLIRDSTIDQLNYIKYLGAVLGVLGGLVIWNPILALIGLTSIGLLLIFTDVLLMQFQKNEE
jgi:uncharacterized membrane protein YheB (UPF0754 family)